MIPKLHLINTYVLFDEIFSETILRNFSMYLQYKYRNQIFNMNEELNVNVHLEVSYFLGFQPSTYFKKMWKHWNLTLLMTTHFIMAIYFSE